MNEIPIIRGEERNLICTLPGTKSDQIVITAHYEHEQNEDANNQNWSEAVLLAALYKALQAEPRDHTFVFAELCNDEGEKQFLTSLSRTQRPTPAAAIALDLRGSGPLRYQLSWNAYLVMQQQNASSADTERMQSLRVGERSKAILALSLVKVAQLSGTPLFFEQKVPSTVQNARLILHSTDIPSILIYTIHAPSSPKAQIGARFDLVAAYLCALDNNLSTPSVAVR